MTKQSRHAYSAADAILRYNLRAVLKQGGYDTRGYPKFVYWVYNRQTKRAVEMSCACGANLPASLSEDSASYLAGHLHTSRADFDAEAWLQQRRDHYRGEWRPAHAIGMLLDFLYAMEGDAPTPRDVADLLKEDVQINGETYRLVTDFSTPREEEYTGRVIALWLLGKDGERDLSNGTLSLDEWQHQKWL